MIQKTAQGVQRTDIRLALRGTFINGAATPRQQLGVASSVLCLLMHIPCHLNAEELRDPTRPPAIIAETGAAPGRSPARLATAARPSGLQSTIISTSRRAAIIDGRTVELWARHGDAQLIEVNEGSVVLQGAQTRQVLTLFPGVKINQRATRTNNVSPESEVQPEEVGTIPAVQEEKK